MTFILIQAVVVTIALVLWILFTPKMTGFGPQAHIDLLLVIFTVMCWIAVVFVYFKTVSKEPSSTRELPAATSPASRP